MKKKKKGLYIEYPKRPFLIYPSKYNELFLILPICFVMFFIKGGGWAYSIVVLSAWFIISILWTKRYWESECSEKGMCNVYYDGEWLNDPEKEDIDFHKDPRSHKYDELHFLYDDEKKQWISHDELKQRYDKYIEDDPNNREYHERTLKKIEAAHDEWIMRGW